jgi:hypothetical protein
LRALKILVAKVRRLVHDLDRSAAAEELRLQLVEIVAGAERVPPAAEHDDAHLRPVDRLPELLHELGAYAVPLVRPVEPDARDVVLDVVLDRVGLESLGHTPSFLLN